MTNYTTNLLSKTINWHVFRKRQKRDNISSLHGTGGETLLWIDFNSLVFWDFDIATIGLEDFTTSCIEYHSWNISEVKEMQKPARGL